MPPRFRKYCSIACRRAAANDRAALREFMDDGVLEVLDRDQLAAWIAVCRAHRDLSIALWRKLHPTKAATIPQPYWFAFHDRGPDLYVDLGRSEAERIGPNFCRWPGENLLISDAGKAAIARFLGYQYQDGRQ